MRVIARVIRVATEALALCALLGPLPAAAQVPRTRRPTKPTRASQQRRLEGKTLRGGVKAGRAKVSF